MGRGEHEAPRPFLCFMEEPHEQRRESRDGGGSLRPRYPLSCLVCCSSRRPIRPHLEMVAARVKEGPGSRAIPRCLGPLYVQPLSRLMLDVQSQVHPLAPVLSARQDRGFHATLEPPLCPSPATAKLHSYSGPQDIVEAYYVYVYPRIRFTTVLTNNYSTGGI